MHYISLHASCLKLLFASCQQYFYYIRVKWYLPYFIRNVDIKDKNHFSARSHYMILKFVNMMLHGYDGRSSHILENKVTVWFHFSFIYEKKNFHLIKHNTKCLSLKTSFTLKVIENDTLEVVSITILIWIIVHGKYFSRFIAYVIYYCI